MENSIRMIYIENVDMYGQKIEIIKDNGIKIKKHGIQELQNFLIKQYLMDCIKLEIICQQILE
ncbi:unnamed protein product [Paramecium pentaurelia]|uniref:Uncharacterized protein n=1 Tax=Paramecium pentaurelia TaxID=43138 RepID=A0A8S1RYL9_9CILI|nr:unnamed protein product [Paramecium pentaurelia]